MNIEFGCGENPTRPEYKRCDIRELPGIDFVCPAWEISKLVQPDTVDNVFSRHMFEHLTFRQGELLLKAWKTILKPGGTVEMLLPNLAYHIQQYLTKSDLGHARAGFWGWQRGELDDTWDVHKSGYDRIDLKKLVQALGYVEYTSLEPDNSKHLHVTFRKPE